MYLFPYYKKLFYFEIERKQNNKLVDWYECGNEN